MKSLLPFDEINRLEDRLKSEYGDKDGRIKRKAAAGDIIDEMLDLFLLAYYNGAKDANGQLDSNVEPDVQAAETTINRPIEGKTWTERVTEEVSAARQGEADEQTSFPTNKTPAGAPGNAPKGTINDIIRIVRTETHRIFNESAFQTATAAGAKEKTWRCMMLPTSRDTHIYLSGTTVPIDAEFWTFAGNHAMFPGQFGVPDEDCNCECILTFKK